MSDDARLSISDVRPVSVAVDGQTVDMELVTPTGEVVPVRIAYADMAKIIGNFVICRDRATEKNAERPGFNPIAAGALAVYKGRAGGVAKGPGVPRVFVSLVFDVFPLNFLLSPDEAEAVAGDLTKWADAARRTDPKLATH